MRKTLYIIIIILTTLLLSSCYAKNTAQATDSDIANSMEKITVDATPGDECPQGYQWNQENNICEKCEGECELSS